MPTSAAERGPLVDLSEIDIASFAAAHAGGATVIDVREPGEYRDGHVPGAVLIPLGEIPERVEEIPAEGPVYLVCALGGRSMRAAEHLAGLGREVVNVQGGTKGWIDAGHPTVLGDAPT